MKFDQLLKAILNKPSSIKIKIHNKNTTIKGMSRYTSKNSYSDEYIKIALSDKSQLIVILPAKELFYAPKPIKRIKIITDKEIGKKTIVEFNNFKFRLVNRNDYQYCLEHYVGRAGKNIEGECRFSDYVSSDGNQMLSLGWLSDTGKRADVYAVRLNLTDILIS